MLGAGDSLKIVLTATEDGKGKRPHQAFLLLRDPDTGLEATFPFSVKDTGKSKVDFVRIMSQFLSQETCLISLQTQKDIPVQLLSTQQPLSATLLLASFGSSKPFSSHVFDLELKHDPNVPLPKHEKPLRYGKREEIHHIFRADPKSGPKIISLFFVLAVLATLPVLLGAVCSIAVHEDVCYFTNGT
jgi:oligosaccharyltransferase complex subunit delta (ribophorin II)